MSKYSFIIGSTPKRLIDERGAGIFLHQPALLAKMEKAGWIRPVVRRDKTKLYDLNQLDKCVDRLVAGEFPE
jgi:hypothetical protein